MCCCGEAFLCFWLDNASAQVSVLCDVRFSLRSSIVISKGFIF